MSIFIKGYMKAEPRLRLKLSIMINLQVIISYMKAEPRLRLKQFLEDLACAFQSYMKAEPRLRLKLEQVVIRVVQHLVT